MCPRVNMASRSLAYSERRSPKRLAADRIAALVEDSMSRMGLSEEEKNKRVQKFANRVGRVRTAKQK